MIIWTLKLTVRWFGIRWWQAGCEARRQPEVLLLDVWHGGARQLLLLRPCVTLSGCRGSGERSTDSLHGAYPFCLLIQQSAPRIALTGLARLVQKILHTRAYKCGECVCHNALGATLEYMYMKISAHGCRGNGKLCLTKRYKGYQCETLCNHPS